MPKFTVIFTQKFSDDLDGIGPDGYDWTDTKRGIQWYLERDPKAVGYSTQDTEVRIYLQDRPLGLSGVKVFYLIEGTKVTLLTAWAYDIQDDE